MVPNNRIGRTHAVSALRQTTGLARNNDQFRKTRLNEDTYLLEARDDENTDYTVAETGS